MTDARDVTTKLSVPRPINLFLLENRIVIKDNPAISPDLTLDAPGLARELRAETALFAALPDGKAAAAAARSAILYPQSEFALAGGRAFVVESRRTGDSALLLKNDRSVPFDSVDMIQGVRVIPLTWDNLVVLKNLLLSEDPGCTVFPKADSALAHASLGVGARFTTLHWPAVAWTMKWLALPLTANQDSTPRESVHDLDAMLDNRLMEIASPSIGGTVPEGHQGQSMQGVSLAAVIAYLKLGFHRHRIPWGFNADHQPVGGRFDAIEEQLVEDSLFASYIAYDLSPELSAIQPTAEQTKREEPFRATVDPEVHQAVASRLAQLGLPMAPPLERLEAHLWPAMRKIARRDAACAHIRQEQFASPDARRFLRELALDDIAGPTSPEALAVCLALAEALSLRFDFVTPNLGFRDNLAHAGETDLRAKVVRLCEVARSFGTSLGFRADRGEDAQGFRVCGEVTSGKLKIEASGRDTCEMGAALAASRAPQDQQLWRDWHAFTQKLATENAFSTHEARRKLAREFISTSFDAAGLSTNGVFDGPAALEKALAALGLSPAHKFWCEYAFLFVLAAEGSTAKLGDHSPAGYQQRARFYGISDEGKLLFAKNVATHLISLAETSGLCPVERSEAARDRLAAIETYAEFLADVA